MLMQALFHVAIPNFSHHPATMADEHMPIHVELAEAVHNAEALLKAAKERQRKAEEAAEEKRKAEEAERKCKADEAEALKVEAACKAAEAEMAKAAKEKAEQEEAKKIQAANAAMEAGIVAHEANKQKTAKESAAARAKAQALATRQKKLAKLGVTPDDPLILVPEGPGPTREEMRQIHKQVAGQARKRKVGDTEFSVSDSQRFGVRYVNLVFLGCMHILCTAGFGVHARKRKSVHVVQHKKGSVLFPGREKIGRNNRVV
jgi:chemotaxis protein histidine kinase CheA